jgi:hypothetical protein
VVVGGGAAGSICCLFNLSISNCMLLLLLLLIALCVSLPCCSWHLVRYDYKEQVAAQLPWEVLRESDQNIGQVQQHVKSKVGHVAMGAAVPASTPTTGDNVIQACDSCFSAADIVISALSCPVLQLQLLAQAVNFPPDQIHSAPLEFMKTLVAHVHPFYFPVEGVSLEPYDLGVPDPSASPVSSLCALQQQQQQQQQGQQQGQQQQQAMPLPLLLTQAVAVPLESVRGEGDLAEDPRQTSLKQQQQQQQQPPVLLDLPAFAVSVEELGQQLVLQVQQHKWWSLALSAAARVCSYGPAAWAATAGSSSDRGTAANSGSAAGSLKDPEDPREEWEVGGAAVAAGGAGVAGAGPRHGEHATVITGTRRFTLLWQGSGMRMLLAPTADEKRPVKLRRGQQSLPSTLGSWCNVCDNDPGVVCDLLLLLLLLLLLPAGAAAAAAAGSSGSGSGMRGLLRELRSWAAEGRLCWGITITRCSDGLPLPLRQVSGLGAAAAGGGAAAGRGVVDAACCIGASFFCTSLLLSPLGAPGGGRQQQPLV